MSKPANRNRYWMCPFFKWDGTREVNCEGGKICFPTRESADEYITAFCAANPAWEQCTVAAALVKYYEQEDSNEEDRRDQGTTQSAGGTKPPES